jgi:hypothetical protein
MSRLDAAELYPPGLSWIAVSRPPAVPGVMSRGARGSAAETGAKTLGGHERERRKLETMLLHTSESRIRQANAGGRVTARRGARVTGRARAGPRLQAAVADALSS